jgi:hypothetical protein
LTKIIPTSTTDFEYNTAYWIKLYKLTRKKNAPRYLDEVYFPALKYNRIADSTSPKIDNDRSMLIETFEQK